MILLDTHVVLWWANVDPRLSQRAGREIARARSVLVSPVSLWEIATLVRRSRVALDRDPHDWTNDLLDTEAVELAEVSPHAGLGAGLLPDEFSGDPADRILYAQARDLGVPIVTKDGRIRSYARRMREVRTVW